MEGQAVYATGISREQRCQAALMCMAEAGYPMPDAEIDGGTILLGDSAVSAGWLSSPEFWAASYKAAVIVGAATAQRWCAEHFIADRLRGPFRLMPSKYCPCHDEATK